MASNWEEELRKLLEGESPLPPPVRPPPPILRREPAPPAPPPIIVREVPRPAPMPPPLPRGVVVTQPEIIAEDDHERHEGGGHLNKLEEAATAFLRGSRVQESVAERMQRVDARTEKHTPNALNPTPAVAPRQVSRSPEVAAVVGLLRQPQTARQVVIASLILAPPKAMEG